jgi:hypothetical protein
MFSHNFVVDEKINLIFSNGKMHKVQMCKVQMPKLQMHKLQMSMLVIHHYQLLISQFLKILLKIFSNKKMHSSNAQTSNAQISNVNVGDTSLPASDIPVSKNSSKRLRGVDGNEFNISSLEYDHGLRCQI